MSDALKIKAIPTPKGSDHKPCKYPELPQHEFTLGIIAPKGSGKTTTIINLLRMYKGYFHQILIMSPTIGCDNKWLWVRCISCLLYTSPSPRDRTRSRMPSSA